MHCLSGSKRYWRFLLIMVALVLITTIPAGADYIGPKGRSYTTTEKVDYGVWARPARYPGECKDASGANKDCTICDWEGSPGSACGDATYSYKLGTRTIETAENYPNATISGAYSCASPGANGWCKSGARIDFTAREPVGGKVIQYVEGNLGIYCDPGDAATVTCNWTPPQGGNTITYWAHSSYGDTTAAGTISGTVAFDSGAPSVSVNVGAPNGSNGWFISPVTATAAGSDGTSGLAGLNVNLDSGVWLGNGTVFSDQGAHAVRGLATDNAGNTAVSGAVTFSLDTVKPTISAGIPAPNGSGGWFRTGPVSLSVAGTDTTSGMSSAQIQVGSGGWTSNSASIASDGSYTVNFRTTDVAGNTNTTSGTVKLDQTAPSGSISLTGTPGANGWYVTKPVATAAGSDATSGVASSQVNLDGGAWAGTVTVPDGTHTVTGLVTDNAGNTGSIAASTVKVDTVLPTLSPSYTAADGSNGWYKTAVTLSVSGTDVTSGLAAAEIQIDGGAWQANSATLSSDGTHSVVFRTRDNAGNVNTQTVSFKVDRSTPTVSITPYGSNGQAGWFVSSVSTDLSTTDGLSGIATKEYRVDSGAWTPVTGALTLTDGVHTVDLRATDNAGNSATTTRTISVDATAPALSRVVPAPDGLGSWYVSSVDLSVSGSDAGSGLAAAEIQVDGGSWTASSKTVSTDGNHTVVFRTRDVAGNITTQTVGLAIDLAGPAVSVTPAGISGQGGWYVSAVAVTATANDTVSGVASRVYRVDGGAWTALTPAGFTLSDGKHTIEVRSIDNAGNDTVVTRAIHVDTIKPALSKVIPAVDGSNGWYINPVSLAVSGTDGGSGVASADIQVDSGTWTASRVTVTTEGPHTLNFRVRDSAGNESAQSASIKLDLAGPAVSIVPTGKSGAGVWYISNVAVVASAADSVSGLANTEYKVDSGAWAPLVASFTVTDGVHLVSVRSSDAAGNLSTATRSLSVDTTAPVVLKTIPAPDGKGGWYINNPTLAVGGADATSGVDYAEIQIDGGAWARDKATAAGDGPHTLNFRVVDHAGNTGTSSASIKIDTVDPVAAYSVPFGKSGSNGWYVSSSVTGAVSVTDATSGVSAVSHRIDGGAWTAGSSAAIATDGVHTLAFSFTDNAGNTVTLTRAVKVDSTLPEITPIATGTEGKNNWWTTVVVVDPNPSDQTAGVAKTEISINGGPWQAMGKATLDKDGLYVVNVRVTDQAGNVLTDTLNYKVDMTDPVCVIQQPADGQLLTGKIPVSGSCADGGAGIETTVISVDGGKTWTEVPLIEGGWSYTWDTVLYPGPVIVKGSDKAGNEEVGESHTYTLVNELPRVDLQEQWYIWNSGVLKIWVGDLPVTRVEISIADWQDRWPAREWEFDNVKEAPLEIKWDRKFADGTLAPIGDYAVRVTVWDSYQRSAKDLGKIVIPAVPQPTVQATVTQADTAMALPSPTPVATRTPVPTATILPSPTAASIAVVEEPAQTVDVKVPPVLKNYSGLVLAFLTLLGLLLALGFQAVRDPRPRAIHQLVDTFVRLSELQERK